jgi:hypothetical protein
MVSGCATHADALRAARQAYFRGDLASAAQAINKGLEKPTPNADVLLLERAMVELASGRPKQAETTLRTVRDRFDHLEQSSAAEHAISFFTDDNSLAYAGEDYEKVLVRAFLALSNLVTDGEDATAYSWQIADKQRQIVEAGRLPTGENPKLAYKQVALGAYIHGLLREETHSNFDDAAHAYGLVVSWQPDFRPGQQDLERARHGKHSERGQGVLYVFTLVGRGPYKEETLEVPSTAALIIADNVLRILGPHRLPPSLAPIKVPKVVCPPNAISNVQVRVNGRAAGQTETITDVGRMARQQHEAIFDSIVARALVRRIVKKGVLYAAKEAFLAPENALGSLAIDVGGIAWEFTESADTRCWGLLPDKIQVLRVELPAGEQEISLRAASGSQPLGPAATVRVRIEDGRNTYLLASFPGSRPVGQALTNRPGQ